MTVTLPPFLVALGVVLGTAVAGLWTFLVLTVVAVLFFEEPGPGWLWRSRWPVSIAVTGLTFWWLAGMA